MVIYLEKKMERSNSGDWKMIFGTNLSTPNIGLMKCGWVEWQEAEAPRNNFNIAMIHQDKECFYLRALQGHSGRNPFDLSLQDNVLIPNNFFEYIHHIGCAINLHSIINSGLIPGGQKLSKRQTVFFTSVDPMNKEYRDPNTVDLKAPLLAWYKQKTWKRHQHTVYSVDIKLAQQKGFKFYQTRSNALILHETLPAYCVPKVVRIETGGVISEKVFATPRPPPKISLKHDWMKELSSEVAGGRNHLVRLLRRSKKMSCFSCESTNVSTERLAKSCVPVLVERVDKDKDADENVDADQTSTERPVSGQSIGLFTQLEEIDIDFRVSGYCHMQLWNKQKTSVFANSWRRWRVILIEKHFEPTRSKITSTTHLVTMRKRWFVKWAMQSYSSYAKQFQRCNAQNAFFIGVKEWSIALVDISWEKVNPADIFTNGDWMLSHSRTTSSRRGDPMVLGTAKLKHRKSTVCRTLRGGDVSKRILMEFTIVSYETQYIVTRNSKLVGPRRSASRWINSTRMTTPTAYPMRSMKDIRNIGISRWTNRARMHRWNSDRTSEKHWQICTVSTVNLEKSDLNQILLINTKGGIRRLLHPVPHGGSGMNTGGAHNNYFFICCSKIVYSWWQSAATDGVCEQNTSHDTFSHVSLHSWQCRTWHWLEV